MKLKNLLTIIVAILLALCIGEILIRLYNYAKTSDSHIIFSLNKKLVYEQKPSISFVNEHGIKVKHNSLGFIGNEIQKKESGIFRILCVGDSVTNATYLKEADRYVNKLENILASKIGRQVEAINAGIGGYNTWQELELIKTKGLSLKPDLIIVGICLNDSVYNRPMIKEGFFGGITENIRDGSKASHFDFVYQRSDLYKFSYDFLSKVKKGFFTDEYFKDYLENYQFIIDEKDFAHWKESLKDMIVLSKEGETEILFVIFPIRSWIFREQKESYPPLTSFFKKNNADFVDLIEPFRKEDKSTETTFVKRDILHPSALGHKIAAEEIAKHIIAKRNQ